MARMRGRAASVLVLAAAGLLLRHVDPGFLEAVHGNFAGRRVGTRGTRSRTIARQQDVRAPGRRVDATDFSTGRADMYQLLTQREHVLHRPDMYIGPVTPRKEDVWVFEEIRKKVTMEQKSLTISPGLVQIFNEILVNAIDRQFESGMSEIRIDVDQKEGQIRISNDGGPIPIERHESGLFVPSLVFGEFLSGDNFNDTQVRFTGGRNGVGAKATNAFSSIFEVEVEDPGSGKRFIQRWENNMKDCSEPEMTELPTSVTQGRVTVSFKPDLAKFHLKKIDLDHMTFMKARAYDAAACTKEGITVYFNDKALPTQDFEEFSTKMLGKSIAVTKIVDANGNVRAEVAAGFAEENGFAALGFVNGMRCSRGTHVNYAVEQIAHGIANLAPAGPTMPTAAIVKQYFRVVVKVLVDNPDFDSQTKTRLTTISSKLGFDFVIPSDFISEIAELGVLSAAIKATQAAQKRLMREELGSGSPPSTAKLEEAELAGQPGEECTLILTEGDSAKALAVAGLAKIGRQRYGVFPLKGKVLNVRSATDKQIQANQEIKNVMHILGLEWGQEFESAEEVKSLRYQKVMIFSDQDLDGHHIAGLILSLFLAQWPSLLEVKPDFIQRFATPLVKVSPTRLKSNVSIQEFFTQGEFEAWRRNEGPAWAKRYGAKYYKGLGTSTRQEAMAYFEDMDRHVMDFSYEGGDDKEMIEKVFEPDRADDRKTWLREYSADAELDYNESQASYSDFLNLQMVHFSNYDCVRSIPLLLDGLKPSQRKVLHWALQNLKTGEKKVSQIVGLVSSATGYHHGEDSLVKVVVHLAQDFVGANNINLLEPVGMFGTRLNGRDVHASARYIHTKLSPLVRKIFLAEDLNLLPPQQEDGQPIEPRALLPILPLALVNGFQGIGTGWSTNAPNFDPLEVVASLEKIIQGKKRGKPLMPSYRRFRGEVVELNGKFYSKGTWKVFSSEGEGGSLDTVEITELPIGVWTHDFIEMVEKKAKTKNFMLKVYKCQDHNDQNIHLLIGFDANQLLKKPVVDVNKMVEQTLGLRKRLPTQMWLYEVPELAEGRTAARLEHFEDAGEILEAFYRARLPFYELRKEKLQRKMSEEVTKLSNKVRCVRMCKDGSLKLRELCASGLEEQGFEKMGGASSEDEEADTGDDAAESTKAGFDYLLRMSLGQLSDAGAENMERELATAEKELARIRDLKPTDMWLEDLSAFRGAYTAEEAKRRPDDELHLTENDLRKAEKLFEQERKRQSALRAKRNKDVGSMNIHELQEFARSKGLAYAQKSRKALMDILLKYTTAGYSAKEWTKMLVPELEPHLELRGLSKAGRKADWALRLSKAPLPMFEWRLRSSSEMRAWLRKEIGLPAGANDRLPDVEQRFCTVKQRLFQEEAALKKQGSDLLTELAPEVVGEDELTSSLARCLMLARSADLGQPIKNTLTPKEECWATTGSANPRKVKCIREARDSIGMSGSDFEPLVLGSQLCAEIQRRFAEECFKRRF